MKNESISKTIKTIRTLGVVALLLSGFVFLLQGYSNWDGFQRFLAFSGVNLLVGGFGVFCAQVWQEPKGARTMLALAAAGVSAQFAQLGGMTYNVWHKWKLHAKALSQSDMSGFLKSEVPEIFSQLDVQPIQLLIASIILVAMTLPLCRITFKVLNRKDYKALFFIFMVNAVFLLLPFRSSFLVIVGLGLAGLLLYRAIGKTDIDLHNTHTFEKWLGLLIAMTPVLIGVVRGLFYVNSVFMFGAILFLGITAINFIYKEFGFSNTQKSPFFVIKPKKKHSMTLMWALLTWSCFMIEWLQNIQLPVAWEFFIILTPMVIASGECVRRGWLDRGVGQLLSIFIVVGFGYGQLMDASLANGVFLTLIALVATLYGFFNRDKSVFIVGCIAVLAGLIQIALLGLTLDFVFSWINLAALGIITILLASFMEVRFKQLKDWHRELNQRFSKSL